VEFLTGLLFKDPQGKFKTIALQLAKGGILTRYGREDERRADDMAYYLLGRAGFPTSGLLRFLKRLQSLERGGIPVPFLSSHPPTPERIARLESLERGQAPPPIYSW
jgi:predicted Zn-dependent protease